MAWPGLPGVPPGEGLCILNLLVPHLSNYCLSCFFLLAAIPAAAIGVLLTHNAWERELQTVHEQHLQIARNLVAALARYAADVEAAFQMTVANVTAQQPVRRVSTLLSGLHFKHVCIVNAQGQVEHLIAPDADLRIESVPQPLLEKLRAGGTWEVLPDHAGEPTLFLLQPLDGERYALGALQTEYFVELQRVPLCSARKATQRLWTGVVGSSPIRIRNGGPPCGTSRHQSQCAT